MSTLSAQLQDVSAVTIRRSGNTSALSGVHVLINTKDFGFTVHQTSPPTQRTSVQLVDALRPFPPVIYQTGSFNVNPTAPLLPGRTDFYTDIELQNNSRLTYVRADVPHNSFPLFYATMSYDTATLALTHIDPIPGFDGHDYQVNSRNDVLFASIFLDTMDISCLSGTASDMGVVQTQRIMVKDHNGNITFSWDPFASGDFSACEMRYFTGSNFTYTAQYPLDWSHFNSARWANDSNIIVSFRYTGCFKINVHTGHVMWKLGGLDPSAIPVPDSLMYFSQHDFVQRPDGKYTVYSDGDDTHRYMEGLTYDINENNSTARLVGRFRSADTTYSLAMGSYRYYDDNLRFINYGWYAPATPIIPPPNLFCDIFDSTNNILASLVTPFNQIPYRAIPTAWSPDHLRPAIAESGSSLSAVLPSASRYYDVRWYELTNDSTAVLVDSGTVCTAPIAGHKYVTDALVDSSTVYNWRITSTPYLFTGAAGVNEPDMQVSLQILPNPAKGKFHIINGGVETVCKIYNALGMEVQDITVHKGENTFDAPDASGIYFIKPLSGGNVHTYKLVIE